MNHDYVRICREDQQTAIQDLALHWNDIKNPHPDRAVSVAAMAVGSDTRGVLRDLIDVPISLVFTNYSSGVSGNLAKRSGMGAFCYLTVHSLSYSDPTVPMRWETLVDTNFFRQRFRGNFIKIEFLMEPSFSITFRAIKAATASFLVGVSDNNYQSYLSETHPAVPECENHRKRMLDVMKKLELKSWVARRVAENAAKMSRPGR